MNAPGKQKQTPTIGRIVRYVLKADDSIGRGVRPAMITAVGMGPDADAVALTVWMVPTLDGQATYGLLPFMTLSAVVNDDDMKKPGTWHWPDRT